MNRGRALRLVLIGVSVSVVTALVLVAGTALVLVRRPLPHRDGDVRVDGLSGDVSVLRGDAAVPDVYATTPVDLFRGQGYVQAQERFYEMDVRRRVATGTLAELVGDEHGAVASDVLARTIGFARIAEAELPLLDSETRDALDGYARGVNDYLKDRSPSRISLNYTLLGGGGDLPTIRPWTAVDSLAVLKYLAWDMAGNVDDELGRSLAFGALDDVDRVDQIYPPFPYAEHSPVVVGTSGSAASLPLRSDRTATWSTGAGAATLVPGLEELRPALASLNRTLAGMPRLIGHDQVTGSNAWALSGQHTASGKPLLANDPHLPVAAPGVAVQVGLHCRTVSEACPYDVSGFGIAGLPGVLAGHTSQVAWGFANLLADVADLYLERFSPDGKSTQHDGELAPVTVREEVITIADADPRTVTVRTTSHGPLISEAVPAAARAGRAPLLPEDGPSAADGFGVALAWTGSTPGTSMAGLLALARSTDLRSFRKAAADISAPALSLVYADAAGHIGYVAAGAVPERAPAQPGEEVPSDGSWPQPGWDGGRDWLDVVDGRDLPWIEDPAEGFVVAANQAVTRPISGTPLSRDFDAGYRSERVRDLLAQLVDSDARADLDAMARIQRDTANGIAPTLVPLLLKANVDSFTRDAQQLLVGWDHTQPGDSAAAAYYNAVWAQLLDLTFGDELPEGIRPDGGARWFEVVRRLLDRPGDKWWDDRRTTGLGETRDAILVNALTQARLSLTSKLGKDPSRWRWARLHSVTLGQDPVTSAGNGLARRVVDLGPREAGGGSSVVDAFAWDAADGFEVTTAPAYRMVVDLGAPDRSGWVAQTGVSGHPFDGHYDDQLDDWLAGRLRPWSFSAGAVEAGGDEELRLTSTG